MVNILRDNPLDFVEVIPCRLKGPRGIVKAFLLTRDKKMLLIDAGYSEEDSNLIINRIRGIGREPADLEMCILTHRDVDHVGGLRKLKETLGFKVACHEAEAIWVEKNSGVRPDVLLKDGDTLPFAGGTRVVHTPGHSDGHISLYLPEKKTFIGGDAILSAGEHLVPSIGALSDKPELARESAKKLLQLDIESLLVAHGDDIYSKAAEPIKSMFIERRTFGR